MSFMLPSSDSKFAANPAARRQPGSRCRESRSLPAGEPAADASVDQARGPGGGRDPLDERHRVEHVLDGDKNLQSAADVADRAQIVARIAGKPGAAERIVASLRERRRGNEVDVQI